ncbi:class I SAM-dependent methyltransferase [Rhizobium rhizogenes]|uniref:class I SAM-dependent methyltransferase n=1 Tax=Rhizobium rhizogenes TaxID=359 RepID=UPI0015743AE6|nr:class I SAM-dependent methyltransferase [Rhizobium rhizogenes]NTG07165.1 class I SAM-dependent methyltransferase [Rhizobium rhizogenes]
MATEQDRIRDHWNEMSKVVIRRGRWWQSPTILRHINQRVAGISSDEVHEGFNHLIEQAANGRSFERALSIGSGIASKELRLAQRGIVKHFDCFDLSDERIEAGKKLWEEAGLASAVTFHCEDPFKTGLKNSYDLVYWNNALHHMMDAFSAVEASRNALVPGGLFAMDDFVGASRFQWPDRQLDLATDFRRGLTERHRFSHPAKVERPTVESVIAADPSEAPDSLNIIAAIKDFFPGATIIPTGGVIYHLALSDALEGIDETEDLSLLNTAMMLDSALSDLGENLYAVAIARKG